MTHATSKPLIVQSDLSIVLEVDHPQFEEARDRLAQFAELVKSPEHLHFYRVTNISIWNAAALGVPLRSILDYLRDESRYPLPGVVAHEIERWYSRYGVLRLRRDDAGLILTTDVPAALDEVAASRLVAPFLGRRLAGTGGPDG